MVLLARVLLGATPATKLGVNDTFRGFVHVEDGRRVHAYIKDLDPKQLANEVLASTLAKMLGLSTPEAFLAVVEESVLPCKKGPTVTPTSRLVFASADLSVPNVSQQFQLYGASYETTPLFQELANWGELGKVYAFDSWIANIDRHSGNMLFTSTPPFSIIDHGHSFTGPNWTIPELNPVGLFNNRLKDWVTGYLSAQQRIDRANEAQAFAGPISSLDVSSAALGSRIQEIVDTAEVEAIKSFLEDRKSEVAKSAVAALGNPIIVTGP